MNGHSHLDAHSKPPAHVINIFKSFHRQKKRKLDEDSELLDFERLDDEQKNRLKQVGVLHKERVIEACMALESTADETIREELGDSCKDKTVWEHENCPGLQIIPSLLPRRTQLSLLSLLLHRDLSNPAHLTNLHFHHTLAYPDQSASFFTYPPVSPVSLQPQDPNIHKPISIKSMLDRKLRWCTIGGQYNWTAKVYPDEKPPPFPPDTAKFLSGLFPQMKAEAAIVNVYSPGDTLSMHRDVAEESERGLVSISLGCDAIFVAGLGVDSTSPQDESDQVKKPPLVVRLRSGDAVFMGGESRFAWHGVPQIVSGTCPTYLMDWPGGQNGQSTEYEAWKGWMEGKRINLNVRQMWD